MSKEHTPCDGVDYNVAGGHGQDWGLPHVNEPMDYNMVDTRYKPATTRHKGHVAFKNANLTIYWHHARNGHLVTDPENYV